MGSLMNSLQHVKAAPCRTAGLSLSRYGKAALRTNSLRVCPETASLSRQIIELKLNMLTVEIKTS